MERAGLSRCQYFGSCLDIRKLYNNLLAMHNGGVILVGDKFTALRKIKEYFKALLISLAVGTIAGLVARYSVFPIMGLLHNRWFSVISSETVKLVYFWIGQIVGSLALVIYMYSKLREYKWSRPGSVIAIVISILLLIVFGVIIGTILTAIINK